MKALILHISDIHFKKNVNHKNISSKIVSAVQAAHSRHDAFLIIVTGDIAQSGKKEEYELAEKFLKEVMEGAQKISSACHITMCPGNHDCNFDESNAVRDIVLERITATPDIKIDEEIIETLCSIQKEYFDFQDLFQEKKNKIFSRNIIEIGEHKILIDSLNVAWMSKLKESQGKLKFPIDVIEEPDEASIKLAIYHHPTNWLEANNARNFEEKLQNTYHLIFTGHEHQEKYQSIINLNDSDHSTYINGGVLHDHHSKNSSFTTLEIDLEKKELSYKTWKLNDKEKIYIQNDFNNQPVIIGAKKTINHSKACPDKDFQEFLNSVEIPFQHPRVADLTLDKIYTPINLSSNEKISKKEASDIETKTSTKNLHNKLISENFITIVGEPQSGKTTTLKILYKQLLKKDFLPIYIHGDSIKKKQKNEIDIIIKSAIKKQYSAPSYEKIIQTYKSKIAILIDGFESSPLNTDAKDEVINYLSEKFNYIALTMGISSFAASLTMNSDSSLLSIFSTYDLDEFSYSARGDLIEAWVKLGQEDSLSEKELDAIVSKKEELLNSLVHSNLLPTLPGHVLLILQYMETGSTNPNMNGAYGHIYQALVTKMLSNSIKFSIDILIAYLSNMAFSMYQKGATSLDESGMLEAHNSYSSFSDIHLNQNDVIEQLKSLNVIKEINDHFSFKHPYLLYYFVAIYIQKRVTDINEAEKIIENMIETINRDDSCNILIFYSHHANHMNIINKIVTKIELMFAENEPCRFDKDTNEVSMLYKEMAEIVINDRSPKEWRKSRNNELDEKRKKTSPENIKNNSPANSSGLEHKLNSAFRSLDVLGQVLQSNISILSGEMKYQAIKKGCDLSLRITSAFNKFITTESEEIAEEIKKHITDRSLTDIEKSTIASRFIATVTELVIFSILKKLSFSLGSSSLQQSFSKLNDEEKCPPSYKLIETMVLLDNSRFFPRQKIETIYEYLKDFHLAKRMLQRLVHFHFLKYRVEYDTKQWATQLLGLKYVSSKKSQETLSNSRKNH